MLKKITNYFTDLRLQNQLIIKQNNEIILQNKELIWSQVFHDSIRDKKELCNLSINIGRWAGSYTMFYLLYRILEEFKPNKILELGLGESSKFISKFLENYAENSSHLIIEQDEDWKKSFNIKHKLSKQSDIILSSIVDIEINGYLVKVYSSLEDLIKQKFDFYLIDGPHGSIHYSRYDAFKIIQSIDKDQEFIMLFDDYERKGEQETYEMIVSELISKKIKFYSAIYTGTKSVMLIGSEKYKMIENF